ncbi:MAG: hypothetical protein IGBAC_1770 [Ignavibacteriae bacterium]|nr:MAG: hypothetical protein IGBAC_1770 [Ignavibacteriota bacterium]
MWKTEDGSTGRLIQLCIGYFFFYLIFGVAVKYFTEYLVNQIATPELFKSMQIKMNMEFLIYSTIGGNLLALSIAIGLKWYKLKSNLYKNVLGLNIPTELIYIIPSGICTAVVIPTTTLMYTLPISVMVAMVIMRGSIIVISRLVDAIQIKQKILKKRVYKEEEFAVIFAIAAVSVHLFFDKGGGFEFLKNTTAVIILTSYITAYALRLYIMNYFKNTRGKGVPQDNKGFFAIEQISATLTILTVGIVLFSIDNPKSYQVILFQEVLKQPSEYWKWEIIAGISFGVVAFFSVFLFMFKGRTATFAGLVNRLTSLIAGTAATLTSFFLFGGKFPKLSDWISLGFILIAVMFLSVAEKKRTAEMKLEKAM